VSAPRLLQSESLKLYGDFFAQSRLRLEWLWSLYMSEGDAKPQDMIEMLRNLSGSSRALCSDTSILLLTAEFDAMRDEGRALGEALQDFWPGPFFWKHEPSFSHGYFANPAFKCANRCVDEAATALRKIGAVPV